MEREGKNKKDVISALAAVEKAGSLTVEEEHEERSRLKQVEDAEKKERANEKSIEAKIKVIYHAVKGSISPGKLSGDPPICQIVPFQARSPFR